MTLICICLGPLYQVSSSMLCVGRFPRCGCSWSIHQCLRIGSMLVNPIWINNGLMLVRLWIISGCVSSLFDCNSDLLPGPGSYFCCWFLLMVFLVPNASCTKYDAVYIENRFPCPMSTLCSVRPAESPRSCSYRRGCFDVFPFLFSPRFLFLDFCCCLLSDESLLCIWTALGFLPSWSLHTLHLLCSSVWGSGQAQEWSSRAIGYLSIESWESNVLMVFCLCAGSQRPAQSACLLFFACWSFSNLLGWWIVTLTLANCWTTCLVSSATR